MKRNRISLTKFPIAIAILLGSLISGNLNAQSDVDTLNGRNLYRPHNMRQQDTNSAIPANNETQEPVNNDSLQTRMKFVQDSLKARAKFVRDSLEAREKFVRDSIAAREAFIRDSIRHRKMVLDSLNFLKERLPRLLDAALLTLTDQIIVQRDDIKIIGDSMLSNYNCRILPFDLTQPYTPWKTTINLSTKPAKITRDKKNITAIKTPLFECSFTYGKHDDLIMINEKPSIMNRQTGQLYSYPVDSVFFDSRGRITKIKKYIQFYKVTSNYQRGAPLFLHLSQVKQFGYGAGPHYQIVKFCDQWSANDPKKVCNILNYTLSIQNNVYQLTRKMDPSNDFSDGTYFFEFDNQGFLKSVEFKNVRNSEERKTFIDHNDQGYVSRYVYKLKGAVHQTLLINYYLNDPSAKYKVETITCTFEDDGISYYQRNNMTGKSRTRSKMTGEWTPWH